MLQRSDGTVIGQASFQQLAGRVQVRVELGADSGVAPGFHGMHVHDVGKCEGPGFTSAGGHYNPAAANHASHAGDLPVLLVRADGSARESVTTDAFTVSELLAADVAVIVHAGVDNYANIPDRYTTSSGPGADATTKSTGDSGARAACGVVGANEPDLAAGYWMVAADGGVFSHGSAPFEGSAGDLNLKSKVIAMEPTPSGRGYYLVAGDGGIFTYGDAKFEGSTGDLTLNKPVVDMAVPPSDARAVLQGSDGKPLGHVAFAQEKGRVRVTVTASGLTAGFHGFHVHDVGKCEGDFTSAGGHWNPSSSDHGSHAGDNPVLLSKADKTVTESFTTDKYTVADLLSNDVSVIVHAGSDNYANIPSDRYSTSAGPGPDATTKATGDAGARAACGVVAPTGGTTGGGYWLAATDGGVFTFGDADFLGSMGGTPLNSPIVTVASTPTGDGYWMAAADGGIFSFGDAAFFGSTGDIKLNQPIVGMAPTPTGNGYYLVASDGGIFTFGDATFEGSTGAIKLNQPIEGMSVSESGHGYWLYATDGGVFTFGDAPFRGSEGGTKLVEPVRGGASFIG